MNGIRKFRIELQSPFFNSEGKGMALFDLIGTFVIAYVLNEYFMITDTLKIKKEVYYMSLIPIGIISHLLIKQDTFLNKQLFNFDINIYKILLVALIINISLICL